MTSQPKPTQQISAPIQAPPVLRDHWSASSSGPSTNGGMEAARSGCGHLPGPARAMCYSARSAR
ncbi:hypothetical protein, partial [Streptomyces sp. IB201691-2A2]|uniref:hypothetical protein n=1 Tax=Streptomyces sp. IB201691-2A2 TaxID=2561920 RepID=UPI001CA734D7